MKELRISVLLPQDIPESDEGLHKAQQIGREWAVIKLWEAGHLSTREAAKTLGLTYYDYVELLGERGVPVARELSDEATIQDTLAMLRNEGTAR